MRKRPPSRPPPDGLDLDPDDMVDHVMGRLVQLEHRSSRGMAVVRGCIWGLILVVLLVGIWIGLLLAVNPEKPIPGDLRPWIRSVFGDGQNGD